MQAVCQSCGKPIAQTRWWQKYCGGTCRARGFWKRKIRAAQEAALEKGAIPEEITESNDKE